MVYRRSSYSSSSLHHYHHLPYRREAGELTQGSIDKGLKISYSFRAMAHILIQQQSYTLFPIIPTSSPYTPPYLREDDGLWCVFSDSCEDELLFKVWNVVVYIDEFDEHIGSTRVVHTVSDDHLEVISAMRLVVQHRVRSKNTCNEKSWADWIKKFMYSDIKSCKENGCNLHALKFVNFYPNYLISSQIVDINKHKHLKWHEYFWNWRRIAHRKWKQFLYFFMIFFHKIIVC